MSSFPTLHSKKQIKYLWKNDYYRDRIIKYIMKYVRTDRVKVYSDIYSIIRSSITDMHDDVHVYKELFNYLNKISGINNDSDIDRPKERSMAIKSILYQVELVLGETYISSYIDIGSGTGTITDCVGSSLNIPNTYSSDIVLPQIPGDNFLHIEDGKIPLPDNSIDLVTCFVVLHHVNDLNKFFKEITRIMRKNGIFIIREHNVTNPIMRIFLDVIHSISCIVHNNEDIDKFYSEYDVFFQSMKNWDAIINMAGFKKICDITYTMENPQMLYYAAYKYS
jgi:SAM-dependent methyltransferase